MKRNVLDFFEKTLSCKGKEIAVIDGSKKYTFEELDKNALSLGTALNEVTEYVINKPIAVYLPKNFACVVANIGILYSGNAFINLDIKNPLSRIANILDCVKPEFILTSSQYKEQLSKVFSPEKILLVEELVKCDGNRPLLLGKIEKLIDTDPMCLINTSGSTGTPKSVILNHKSFIDFIYWSIETMNWSESEVIGSLSPVVFDIYVYELCLLMSKGATLVAIPDIYAAFPVKMLQLMAENKVTYIFWVPTIMVNIANQHLLERIELNSLKTVWFAGEVFPTKQFNMWRKALPNVTFVNMYGPIEITLDCTHYIVKRELQNDEPIPIGYAMRNTDILLLDENDNLCKPGEDGELCVRGTSLAMGYYNNPEKTAAAFVQNPLNKSYPELIYRTGDVAAVNQYGEIVFKGRRDTLVKHSGYRIELGEIEHVIVNTLGVFTNACVIYDYNKKEIVLIYESTEEADIAAIKKQIATALPKYMIPTIFKQVVEMPRNPNGKIDRLKLKENLNA